MMAVPSDSPKLLLNTHIPASPTSTFQFLSTGGPSASVTSTHTSQTHLFAQLAPHSGPSSRRRSSRASPRGSRSSLLSLACVTPFSHRLRSTLVEKIHSQELCHIGLSGCSAFWWVLETPAASSYPPDFITAGAGEKVFEDHQNVLGRGLYTRGGQFISFGLNDTPISPWLIILVRFILQNSGDASYPKRTCRCTCFRLLYKRAMSRMRDNAVCSTTCSPVRGTP